MRGATLETDNSITVYESLEQGSSEWLEARRGIVTASEVHKLLTSNGRVATNQTARDYIADLAAERITGHVEDAYVSHEMRLGTLNEPYARDGYAEHHNVTVDEVGFMVKQFDGFKLGYSPDGLVNDDGLIEIKSRKPRIQINTILRDGVPKNNLPQIQAGLLVTGRAWCDYVSYSGGLPLWTQRVYPDRRWQDNIIEAVKNAETEIQKLVNLFHAYTKHLPVMERIDHYGDDLEFTFGQ